MDKIDKIDKSLEEEIDRFEDWMETYNQADYPTSFTTRDIARHFAKWQKEQMLKDAVEGVVFDADNEGNHIGYFKLPKDSSFMNGDKVRIVVLKEGE